jgi:hypothetical protein
LNDFTKISVRIICFSYYIHTFAMRSYAIIQKHKNCTTKIQIEKTIVLIKRIESNFDMSNRYRRENFQNLSRSRSQITMRKFSARVTSRRFTSMSRERDYSFVLSDANRKSQISIRFNRVDQITQKWRSFVARFSSTSFQKNFLSSKRKNEMICYNCDKKNHVRSECMISSNKIESRNTKKIRNL